MAVDVHQKVAHPLEPLSADEIRAAVAILRSKQTLSERSRFIQVTLNEPTKAQIMAYREGDEFDRQAFIVLLDNVTGSTWEGIVSLSSESLLSWDHIPNVQPPISLEEFDDCEAACKANPEFREALRKRGIEDIDSVIVDPWSAGSYEDNHGMRLSRALTWVRMGPLDNAYAHPVENLVAIVDLNRMEVVRIEDYGVVPVPKVPGNYSPGDNGPMRTDLKPIEISQPEGVSFTVEGHKVSWQKWSMRLGFTPREGLVLHTIGYEDQGRVRSIIHRLSLSEMVVPYGCTLPVHRRKNAFDAGEYNVGALANSLELGCDCLGEIQYFDAHLVDSKGNPTTIRNAICLHEEDHGLLWKHVDFRTGLTEVRRSRRLVVSWISTVANYEYAFYWYFYLDGTIEFEGKLSGVMTTGTLNQGETRPHGIVLNHDGLYAPIHQHFFNFRIDMDVDGPTNSLYEVEIVREQPGDENPEHSGFYARSTQLTSELQAGREISPLTGRYWAVVNPNVHNMMGQPVGYKLEPLSNVVPFAAAEASVAARSAFASKHLWATAYDQSENHAAGAYPNQHAGGAGLPAWIQADRSLDETDLVLWYTLGAQHVPRLEDWPLVSSAHAGFMLKPVGFFNANASLDVPPTAHANGHGAACDH